jgi:hypothetical protein
MSYDGDVARAQDPLAAARRKGGRGGGKGGGADAGRRPELSLGERFQDVRDFWAKQPPARRRQLLRVPIRRLLQGARAHMRDSSAAQLWLPPVPPRPVAACPSTNL